MTLAINDTAPDFEAQTTEGNIRFHDWIGSSWAVLFSFFPTENELTSLLLSVGTFGAAAVVRPVASVVLGIYADRVGRKAPLTLTIFTMGLGTGLIVLA